MMVEIPFVQEQILCRADNSKHEEIKKEFEIVLNAIDSHKTQILNKLSNMLIDIIKKNMRSEPPEIYRSIQPIQNLES